MSEFENVTVVKKANIYFDGNVTSRTVKFSDGTQKTLGFMQAGEYEFGTQQKELMEIMAGSMQALLPGATSSITVSAGESFEVPANTSFKVTVLEPTDYCCSYFD